MIRSQRLRFVLPTATRLIIGGVAFAGMATVAGFTFGLTTAHKAEAVPSRGGPSEQAPHAEPRGHCNCSHEGGAHAREPGPCHEREKGREQGATTPSPQRPQ